MFKWFVTITTVIYLFLGVFNLTSASASLFIKNTANPIYSGRQFAGWNEIGIFQPSILDDNTLKLWYASFNGQTFKIALANSSDGISWSSLGPIYTEPNRSSHSPSVIKDSNGKYILAYTSSIGGNSNFKIKTITSSNGINFDTNTLQTIQQTNNWELADMAEPLLWKENNTYYLFYIGRNNSQWKLGLAISNDAVTWTRCSNPILYNIGDTTLVKRNNIYSLYYHQTNASGIVVRTSSDSLSCNMTWSQPEYVLTPGQPYDSNHMIAPSIVKKNEILYLYYSGLNSQGKWTLNLATDLPIPTITPTPTILSTPTPTPLPKIFVIPGLLGSWNKDAILHQQSVPQSEWHLMPIFHEIDGLLTTLDHLGYTPEQNLFTFAYDWRQPISTSVEQLKTFIDNNTTSSGLFKIVGHSLGGLVGRLYAQQYPSSNLSKIITAGSPHEGVTDAYKPVAGGELERNDTQFYLAYKTILNLYKSSAIQTDRDVINTNLPVLRDLLPNYPYLKRSDQTFIDPNSMTIKNQLLPTYNATLDQLFPKLHTIAGTNVDTLKGYNVDPPSPLDTLLGNYPDGHPVSAFNDSGDGLVLASSASKGDDPTTINNFYHGDVLAKKTAIKKILDSLQIDYLDSDITPGDQTPTNPALLFFIQSPATMKVIFSGTTYPEQDGIVYIPNALSGTYQLQVMGTGLGDYTITVGELGIENDYWMKIKGKITKNPPSSQTDTYSISFNQTSPQPSQTDQTTLLTQLYSSFDDLITQDPSHKVQIGIMKTTLQTILKPGNKSTPEIVRGHLLSIHAQLLALASKTLGQTLSSYFNTIDLLERFFASYLGSSTSNQNNLTTQFFTTNQLLQNVQRRINLSSQKKMLLNIAVDKIRLANQFRSTQQNYSFILLQTAQKILQIL